MNNIIKLLVAGLLAITMCNCTTIKVKPMKHYDDLKKMCVKECPDECFASGVPTAIIDGFERHNIPVAVYKNEVSDTCSYYTTYKCNITWDMAMYMHHAEISVFSKKDDVRIGYGKFHLVGGGGLSLMKWQSAETKLGPVMDQLLENY